ncbi:MAG: hypothetical protein H5T99_08120, partial [Moorella sp. (in: Bacteria)]|nr:hypothetical protein [Moorella sp. (in: firmicutes)]
AVGYREDRGDQITVTSMAFDTSLEQQMKEEMASRLQRQELLQQYLLWAAAGLAGLLLLILLIVLLLRRRRRKDLQQQLAAEALVTGLKPGLPMEPLVVEAPEEVDVEKQRQEAERKAKLERLRETIRQRPEDAALLLKTWLIED